MISSRKYLFLLTLFLCILFAGIKDGYSAESKANLGVVNFSTCTSQSKLGKQEQAAFESIKTQMTSLLEDTEKQLNELATKFNDSEYMDGLSPEAEQEMKNKYQALAEEMGRYQNQYQQILGQANMRMMQTLVSAIQEASSTVAEKQKLSMVIHKEACFFSSPVLDVTDLIIAEMDKAFEQKHATKNPSKEGGITAENRTVENREAKAKK